MYAVTHSVPRVANDEDDDNDDAAEEAASAGMEGLFEDSSRLHASSRSAPDDDSDEGEDARL